MPIRVFREVSAEGCFSIESRALLSNVRPKIQVRLRHVLLSASASWMPYIYMSVYPDVSPLHSSIPPCGGISSTLQPCASYITFSVGLMAKPESGESCGAAFRSCQMHFKIDSLKSEPQKYSDEKVGEVRYQFMPMLITRSCIRLRLTSGSLSTLPMSTPQSEVRYTLEIWSIEFEFEQRKQRSVKDDLKRVQMNGRLKGGGVICLLCGVEDDGRWKW